MFVSNLKIAVRKLWKNKTYSFINILGLGLGMAAAIFAFLWVQNEFSFDRYHHNEDRLYRINTDIKVSSEETWHWGATPLPLVEVVKNEVPEVVRTATITGFLGPLAVKRNATVLSAKDYAYVSEDWFDMFSHRFLLGAAAGFQDKLQSAILTRDFAEKLFGRWDVAGESFQLDSLEFAVHAVIENHPSNSSFTYQMILPLSYYLQGSRQGERENWDNFNFATFVELRPGSEVDSLNKKLTALAFKYKEDDSVSLSVQPLAEVHFDQERSYGSMLTGNRRMASTFAVIGFVILFLACVNYVSLTTAQAGMRTKEVGVRKIAGAGGPQIFRMMFAESLLTTACALVLALGLVQLAMPFFNQFTEKNFRLDFTNPAIWMVIGGATGAALLLSGIYPALFLTGFSPGNFLRGQNFLKMKNAGFRKGLVVAQFALTIGLIISAIVFYQQQDFINKKDLGYDRSHVFEFMAPCCEGREGSVKAIRQALSAEPGIIGTAASNMSVIDAQSTHSGSIDWDGRPEDFVPTVYQMSVDAGFADLLQLQLAEGRWFLPDSEAEANNVLLNEAAVRLFNMPEPVVGQRFHFQGREGQVIGIVKDFHYLSLRQKIEPLVLCNYAPSNGNILVKTRAGKATEAIAAAETAWKSRYPGRPFEYSFMDDSFGRLYESDRKNAGLFRLLAGLAVFISCLGLFGLAVFSTEQRTKEIGIRKVLGASIAGIARLLASDFLKLVLIALFIASPLAYALMNQWLKDFAYRIDIEWWVFAGAGLIALALAYLTVSVQSIKAALANPVKSLRSE